MPNSSCKLQFFQIDFPCWLVKRFVSGGLMLLHARDSMVAGVIHLDVSIAEIDGQSLLITEKSVARFILASGRIGVLAEPLRPPRIRRLHRLHRSQWAHR